MDLQVYRRIVGLIRSHRGLSKDCLSMLKQEFEDADPDTLYSILALEYQKRMKLNHNKSALTINKYWSLYSASVANQERPGIIVRIAEKFDVCPCLVAKLILQKYFDEEALQQTQPVNVYMRETTLIPDSNLAYEVFLCTLYDNLYSPLSETVKQSLGQQYEIKLHNEVVKLGLAFRDEEHLRKFGYDKTPDVKLDVPVAIEGFIINWIESKALFGDEEVHQEYTRNQYLSYWNRFGPGLVIYWFGFPRSIQDASDRRFIIRNHLPTEGIIKINSFCETRD